MSIKAFSLYHNPILIFSVGQIWKNVHFSCIRFTKTFRISLARSPCYYSGAQKFNEQNHFGGLVCLEIWCNKEHIHVIFFKLSFPFFNFFLGGVESHSSGEVLSMRQLTFRKIMLICSFFWEISLSLNSEHYQPNPKGYLKIIKVSWKQK